MLDEIIQVGKGAGNLTGICFNYQSPNKQGNTLVTKKFHSQRKCDVLMSGQMLQYPIRHQETRTKAKCGPWKCHYCGQHGHIKPFYYKLYGYQKCPIQLRGNHVMIKTIKE
jgi:hypothetical protein